jgi:hypothetical protein
MTTFLADKITVFVWFQVRVFMATRDTCMDNVFACWWLNYMTAFLTNEIAIFVLRKILIVMFTVVAMQNLTAATEIN